MSTRIDGSGAPPAVSVRVERGPVRGRATPERDDGLRRDLVSTFETAFQLDVTNDVLSEIRDRLVTLRAGLQVATGSPEKKAFIDSTMGSIHQLVDMAEFGPVEWPDVPPRERDPEEVLSPLAQSLAESVRTEVLVPDLTSRAQTVDLEAEGDDAAAPAVFVDRAISEIDAARDRVRDARGEVGARATDLVVEHMKRGDGPGARYFDADLAEAAARSMRDRFSSDPDGAVRAMGELDPRAVLSLIV